MSRSTTEKPTDTAPEPRTPPPQTDALTPPELGDFEIFEPIGKGTFGSVWLAKERVTGVYRAVKVFPQTAHDTEITGLCEYQRRASNHAHLIPIYLIGQYGETYYVVMELADDIKGPVAMDPKYYEPCSLDRMLKDRGAMPAPEAAEVLHGMVQAVAYLHQQGLVHRDIKPSNVLFANGVVKLCDFGLIAPGHRAVDRAGTHGYWRPDGPTDRDSDLYALTKVAYQLFTGADVSQFPELPAHLAKSTSSRQYQAIRELLDRGCAAGPARRFASAQAMLGHIETLHPPVGGRSSAAPASGGAGGQIARLTTPLLMLALIAVAAFSAWSAWSRSAAAPFAPLVTATLRTFPEGKGNPNSLLREDPQRLLSKYTYAVSTSNPQPPAWPIRYAKVHVASNPATYMLVFWISPSGYIAVAASERAQKNFRDPVRDAFISLDGEGDNYVVCAFLNDRPFKDSRGLKEAVETLAAEYRDEHPDRKPLPLGMIRVLSRGEVTTISNKAAQPSDDHTSNFGLLGEIRNHFGPSYSVVGFELPLPAERSNPLIPQNPEAPPARPVPDPA